ncbi:MAG: glutathione peroxidase [Candidatus Omnitrophica bacterium]|nr:glutathione peroxidase [Candidatus Omnitrophota bacterium]
MRILKAFPLPAIVAAVAVMAPFQEGGSAADAADIYGFSADSIDGKPVDLSRYRNQVVLIVNTASKCGFTPQYASLQSLYEKYKDRGFTVLGFPSNDFGWQEPGSNEQIREFCDLRFKVRFDLFSKIKVKGKDAHPLYQYLTGAPGFEGGIAWNFTKFLIGPDGKVAARFGSRTDPLDPQVTEKIDSLLSGIR